MLIADTSVADPRARDIVSQMFQFGLLKYPLDNPRIISA